MGFRNLSAPNTNWKVDYRTALVGRDASSRISTPIASTPIGTRRKSGRCHRISNSQPVWRRRSEVHCAAISNSSIGLHGVEVQVAQHTIALRSYGKMTVRAN